MPRDDIGVMLHRADEDFITFAQEEGFTCGVGNEVNSLGRTSCEDEPFRGRGSDEAGDTSTSLLVVLCGELAELVYPSMHIGIGRVVGFVDGLYYASGLLGRGCIIEVDKGLAVYLLT